MVMGHTATPAQSLLAVSCSSVYDPRYQPDYATDGKPDTRWASAIYRGTPEWLLVDLGAEVPVETLVIRWEHAFAVDYEVQVSGDAERWRTLRHVIDGFDGTVTLSGLGGAGRYLRILCHTPGPFPLFSIWELESPDAPLAEALRQAGLRVSQERRREMLRARERLQSVWQEHGIHEVLFAVRQPGVDGHWYANFGYYAADVNHKCYRAGGGKLCRLNLDTGEVTTILDDPAGSVRDPQLHYDGRRAVFSYLSAGSEHYHLYEVNLDGSGLRQLTDGDCDDIEPTYLPDGGIMFCSSRCNRWVNCWLTQVATLYRCEADGGGVRPVSSNNEHDNTPWVLPDGRVLYTRWEYVDRSQVDYHHLWTAAPDGTGQMVFYGNLNPGTVMIDAKPLPGESRVLAVFSPGHGQIEHTGPLAIVDPGDGPDDPTRARLIYTANQYRDPYPITSRVFLAATGAELHMVDDQGNAGLVYQLPDEAIAAGMWLHEPRPITPRAREPVLYPRVTLTRDTGRLLLVDVYRGRNMAGVKRGDVRKLLVLESLPKPINYTGGMDPLTYGGSFTLERVVGTVPVEADGSAYMELPALRSFFFVALDDQDMSVKRMQSFLTVQPGELTGCVGCHERRTQVLPTGQRPMAVRRAPSRPVPVPGVPEVFDFPRDIQPILDRRCVRCHDAGSSSGRVHSSRRPLAPVILNGDRGPMYSHSYFTLTLHRQFVDGRNDPKSNLPPRSIGAVASPLMHKLMGGHHGVRATAQELDLVRYWIESGAPYPGTYGALGSGSIGGYYANSQVETDWDWPETKAAAAAMERRCASCHRGDRGLPRSLSDEREVSFWRPDWNDPRLRLSRHIVFNLTRPQQSLVLLAPLSPEAGGHGTCQGPQGPVFATTEDPDYRAILGMCEAGRRRLEQIGRFDMPGFRPPIPYLREMVRYGILPTIPGPQERVDPYELDRRYWQSLWWSP